MGSQGAESKGGAAQTRLRPPTEPPVWGSPAVRCNGQVPWGWPCLLPEILVLAHCQLVFQCEVFTHPTVGQVICSHGSLLQGRGWRWGGCVVFFLYFFAFMYCGALAYPPVNQWKSSVWAGWNKFTECFGVPVA